MQNLSGTKRSNPIKDESQQDCQDIMSDDDRPPAKRQKLAASAKTARKVKQRQQLDELINNHSAAFAS